MHTYPKQDWAENAKDHNNKAQPRLGRDKAWKLITAQTQELVAASFMAFC